MNWPDIALETSVISQSSMTKYQRTENKLDHHVSHRIVFLSTMSRVRALQGRFNQRSKRHWGLAVFKNKKQEGLKKVRERSCVCARDAQDSRMDSVGPRRGERAAILCWLIWFFVAMQVIERRVKSFKVGSGLLPLFPRFLYKRHFPSDLREEPGVSRRHYNCLGNSEVVYLWIRFLICSFCSVLLQIVFLLLHFLYQNRYYNTWKFLTAFINIHTGSIFYS